MPSSSKHCIPHKKIAWKSRRCCKVFSLTLYCNYQNILPGIFSLQMTPTSLAWLQLCDPHLRNEHEAMDVSYPLHHKSSSKMFWLEFPAPNLPLTSTETAPGKPNIRQMTCASRISKSLLHTVPHSPL